MRPTKSPELRPNWVVVLGICFCFWKVALENTFSRRSPQCMTFQHALSSFLHPLLLTWAMHGSHVELIINLATVFAHAVPSSWNTLPSLAWAQRSPTCSLRLSVVALLGWFLWGAYALFFPSNEPFFLSSLSVLVFSCLFVFYLWAPSE